MSGLLNVRQKLDRLQQQIISHLKDRSQFLLNEPIYLRNSIALTVKNDLSLFEHALMGLEAYHATLGRYRFPDQYPIFPASVIQTPVYSYIDMPRIPEVNLDIHTRVIDFYHNLLPTICKSGNEPNSYGECAFIDAEIVILMHERINLGRFVAYYKAKQDPSIMKLLNMPDELHDALTVRKREDEVIASARQMASGRGLDATVIEKIFRWMIDETIALEVAYLQKVQMPK
jgi:monofunctional chorismate mutase